jgi:hypothetical protein
MPDIQNDEHYGNHHGPCIPMHTDRSLSVGKKYFPAPVFITFFGGHIGKGGLVWAGNRHITKKNRREKPGAPEKIFELR